MPTRRKKSKTEYQKQLDSFRKASDRHVLVIEVQIPEEQKRKLFNDADRVRQCGNELTGIMQRRLDQMMRTKKYRGLLKAYGRAKDNKDEDECNRLADELTSMQKKYQITWDVCRHEMNNIYPRYKIHSVLATTQAEDVWSGVEKVLFDGADRLHFHKRGDLPAMRAKQSYREILVKPGDGNTIRCVYSGTSIVMKPFDRFTEDEISLVLHYLHNSGAIDRDAVQCYQQTGELTDTFRPCYASIVCKTIRGKLRVYVHLTIEGRAVRKYNKDGTERHTYGTGIVGNDIGTQTVAWTSDKEVGLSNLAERGNSITHNERQERILARKMDRSKRAMNPDNYNKDGTIRKGKKTWKKSKRYLKLQKQHADRCRISAVNREYANNVIANHMREQGDVLVTEPKNAKKLQKKASPAKTDEDKNKKRRRFGKSIANRCPGGYQAKLQRLFESTGGAYIEVPGDYRASQYDHIADDYIKKKLSERIYALRDGTIVQRDWYSSFLLHCINLQTMHIDRGKCLREFESQYQKEQIMIQNIIRSHKKIYNSGIRV